MNFNSITSKLPSRQPFNDTSATDNPVSLRPNKSLLSLDFSQVRNTVLQQTRKFHSNEESETVQTTGNANLNIIDDSKIKTNLVSSQCLWNRDNNNRPTDYLENLKNIGRCPIGNQNDAKENNNICHCSNTQVKCFCQTLTEGVTCCLGKISTGDLNDKGNDRTAKSKCFDGSAVTKNENVLCYHKNIGSSPVARTESNTDQLKSGKNETSNISAKLLVGNGNSEPVCLNSPDLEMLKLSTPDLDNYLIQLQKELSLPASAYQQNQTVAVPSVLGYANLDSPQIETMELSEMLPLLTKSECFSIQTPISTESTMSSALAMSGTSVCQDSSGNAFSPLLEKTDVNATMNSNTKRLTLSRDIIDLANQVSMETRFNSFDSGFSDISVKTELESEIEEERGEEEQTEWCRFDNLKPGKILGGFHCLPANASGFNNSNYHYHYTQSNLSYGSTDLKYGCATGARSSLGAGGFMVNSGCANTGNSDNRFQISCSAPVHQSHHHRYYHEQMQHQQQLHQDHTQSNYHQQYETKERCATDFSVSTNDDDGGGALRFITKKAVKKEPPLSFDFCYNACHVSSVGGIYSEYSSFVDDKKTLFSQEATSQRSLNPFSMPHNEHYSEPYNSSTTTGQYKKATTDGIELFQERRVYDVETSCSSGTTHNQPTLQARRMHFKRQNAETEFGNLEIIAEQCRLNDRSRSSECAVAKPIAVTTTTESVSIDDVGSAAAGVSIDLVQQELIKLQRKRAKNRLAATRCRNRKLERINFLKSEVEFLKDVNSKYVERIHNLRQEVDRLKCDVTRHVTSGCDLSCLVSLLR